MYSKLHISWIFYVGYCMKSVLEWTMNIIWQWSLFWETLTFQFSWYHHVTCLPSVFQKFLDIIVPWLFGWGNTRGPMVSITEITSLAPLPSSAITVTTWTYLACPTRSSTTLTPSSTYQVCFFLLIKYAKFKSNLDEPFELFHHFCRAVLFSFSPVLVLGAHLNDIPTANYVICK